MQKNKRRTSMHIPDNPNSIRVFLPAFSTIAREMTVINTFMAPIPRVAIWAVDSVNPAEL